MRDTGIEPVTSSVSGKRATAAPIALEVPGEPDSLSEAGSILADRPCCEVGTGFEPAYTALQAAASPPGHPTRVVETCERMTGFEPATSTLARWRSSQLSYIRTENR